MILLTYYVSTHQFYNVTLPISPTSLKNRVHCSKKTNMTLAAEIFIAIIALLHLYILWFEMFAWESRGPKVFRGFPKELFPKTKTMAANQGLYNGFLSAGLIWSFFIENAEWRDNVALFFLACVAVAGIFGAATASKKILIVQTVPAAIAITLTLLS